MMRRWASAVRPGWYPDASSSAPTSRTGSESWSYRFPSNVAVPPLGATSPSSILSVVVLPAPFGPSSAVTWPGSATALTSSTARRSPNLFVRRPSSTAGAVTSWLRSSRCPGRVKVFIESPLG